MRRWRAGPGVEGAHGQVVVGPVRSRPTGDTAGRPSVPELPGTPERRNRDCVRGGVTTLFAVLNTATGEVIRSLHQRHVWGSRNFLT